LLVAKRWPDAPLLVGGDFNAFPNSGLADVLRSDGWHGFNLAGAYDHPAAADLTPVIEATSAESTCRLVLDHLYYRCPHFRLAGLVQPLVGTERSCFEYGPGLPDQVVPSDHVPIGAVLEIAVVRCTFSQPDAAPVTADAFWSGSSNVLTEPERDELLRIEAMIQQRPRGKPTAEEIASLRQLSAARKSAEQAFLEQLCEDGKVFVTTWRRAKVADAKRQLV